LSGLFLAIHFATWILSLEYTSVLISVVLVSTNPLWVAVLEVGILRARLGRIVFLGLFVGLVGSLVVALSASTSDIFTGKDPLLGSLLAIIAALGFAVYLIIGRNLRTRLSLLPYIWLVYGCATLILLAVVFLLHISLIGYSLKGYAWVVAVALIPQLIGH